MEKQVRNVLVLSCTQATLQITGATIATITGLAGFALATNKSFATVPLTCYVIGSAITTIPASLLMRTIGRRGGFQVGTAVGMFGGAVCSLAVFVGSFWLLCAGMTLMGVYTAFGNTIASPPMPPATQGEGDFPDAGGRHCRRHLRPRWRSAPWIFADYLSWARTVVDFRLPAGDAGAATLGIPKLSEHDLKDSGRPLGVIMRQPIFAVAVLASMLSYGIMNLFMTSTWRCARTITPSTMRRS